MGTCEGAFQELSYIVKPECLSLNGLGVEVQVRIGDLSNPGHQGETRQRNHVPLGTEILATSPSRNGTIGSEDK